MVGPKESKIQKSILDYLKASGYVAWRNYVGPRIINKGAQKHFIPSPMAGLPDIIGILKNIPGRMFAIEVKSSKGELSDKQIFWTRTLERAGALVIITRTLDQVIEVLSSEDTSTTKT
jgi:hypothetical protein